jgi:endonuclease-3
MRWTKPKLTRLQAALRQAYPDARCALDHGDPFQLVAATILSAQCTDARVNLVTPGFFARFPDPERLAEANLLEVETLIRSTGFFHNKAKNLIGMAQALVSRHGGRVPSDPVLLGKLPGVGQKTANVVLANAFGVPALAVDTHIFRVARRLGLSEAKTPEKVEADLCRQFPKRDWIELHHQLIFHGRRACHAQRPACGGCPLLAFCRVGAGEVADPHTGLALQPALPSGPPSRGRGTASESGPQRIVSLVPSVTELLVRWGLATRLVGRTRYCVEPKWIRNTVPALGGTKDPDLKALRELKPDLVILERDENSKATAEALEAAGLPWISLEVRSVADGVAALRLLGKRLGAEADAQREADAIEAAGKVKFPKGPRTLLLVWKEPWMSAGPGTYLGDLLKRSGFEPLGGDLYPVLSDSELEGLRPEVVLLPDEPYRFTARHRAELQKRFPQARVLCVEGKALTWYLSRTLEGLTLLRGLRAEVRRTPK